MCSHLKLHARWTNTGLFKFYFQTSQLHPLVFGELQSHLLFSSWTLIYSLFNFITSSGNGENQFLNSEYAIYLEVQPALQDLGNSALGAHSGPCGAHKHLQSLAGVPAYDTPSPSEVGAISFSGSIC